MMSKDYQCPLCLDLLHIPYLLPCCQHNIWYDPSTYPPNPFALNISEYIQNRSEYIYLNIFKIDLNI